MSKKKLVEKLMNKHNFTYYNFDLKFLKFNL